MSFSCSVRCSFSTSLLKAFMMRDLTAGSTPVDSRTAETDTTNSESCGTSSVGLELGPEPRAALGCGESSDFLFEFLRRDSSGNVWSYFLSLCTSVVRQADSTMDIISNCGSEIFIAECNCGRKSCGQHLISINVCVEEVENPGHHNLFQLKPQPSQRSSR